MQVDPKYTRHQNSKECMVGAERGQQREAAVTSALGLRQQFSVHGEALERVEVFKYLGRLLAQDDDVRGGPMSGRCSGQRMSLHGLRRSSTKRWSRPCYSTAAKRGSS